MATGDHVFSILAVDDEPQILTAIEDLLEDDYTVVSTTDPFEGLERLENREFSVILSDQRMPRLTGDEFLARARRISNASRVLVTGYTDIRAAQRAVNHGKIFAYVSKPWDPVGLKKIVDEGVQHHRFVRDLERSQERKLSLDAARAGVWSWNPHTGDVLWDEAMQSLYGIAEEAFPGVFEAWAKLIHPRDIPAFEEAANRAVQEGSEFDMTFRALRGVDHWRHFRAQAVVVRDDEGQIIRLTGLCVDVTDQQEAEKRLRRYAERLQRARKSQARQIKEIDRQKRELEMRTAELDASNRELKNFAAVAAHDLKEPLRTIAFHTSLLEEGLGDRIDEEARTHILAVRNLSKGLSHLIDAILNYMRLGQGAISFVPRKLSDVVEGVMAVLDAMLREQQIQVHVRGDLPTVLCAPDLIGEVFHNLITNAAKYNDKPEKRIEIAVEGNAGGEPDKFVRIRVSDNGVGIDPAHGDRVFQMFRRLHGRSEFGGGTGVGLTFAKRIIELHGGQIWFESTAGEGTTFHFTLERG
jgi:signal transduction histidine kinase/ActR/RegA family two-component response regulator